MHLLSGFFQGRVCIYSSAKATLLNWMNLPLAWLRAALGWGAYKESIPLDISHELSLRALSHKDKFLHHAGINTKRVVSGDEEFPQYSKMPVFYRKFLPKCVPTLSEDQIIPCKARMGFIACVPTAAYHREIHLSRGVGTANGVPHWKELGRQLMILDLNLRSLW